MLFLMVFVAMTVVPFVAEPAQSDAEPTSITSPESELDETFTDTRVFRPGEMIKLRVTYLGFTAGYITTRVSTREIDGREVFQLKVTGESSGLAYWFYSIRDQFVSYVDPRGYFSLGYEYKQNHGGEKEFEKVRYDHENGLFFRNGEEKGEIPPYSQDILSALFFIRSRDLKVGESYQFPVHVGDEAYRLVIQVEAKEQVATKNRGWMEAYRIKPTVGDPKKEKEFREKLKNEENHVRIWISADSHKTPLRIAVPAKIGSFWGYLTEYEPGRPNRDM